MENIIKDIQDIMEDTRDVVIKSERAKRDIETGINTNHTREYEEVTKQQKIENLFYYLVEAKQDMDEVKDMIKKVQESLDTLLDTVQYEDIAKEIRK
jgi:high-affinity Fe2+/Pb2+ permease